MRYLVLLVTASCLWGCTDSGGLNSDRGGLVVRKDGFFKKHPDGYRSLPDGYVLQECTEVGKACNAHDPCAINPICNPDGKCMPTALMNCDDGLPCTADSCKGAGLCINTPKKGYCKLTVKAKPGQTCKTIKQGSKDAGVPDAGAADAGAGGETIICCFTQGERNPGNNCQACDPGLGAGGDAGKGYATTWSPATGGVCNDGDPCTRNDYCQNGVCQGTSYASQCSDGLTCTTDACDGKGGCLAHLLQAGFCVIDGACRKKGEMHPAGQCSGCDPAQSKHQWSTMANTCAIDGKCHAHGAKDTNGCATCDTKKSKTGWTVSPGFCLIGGLCHKDGIKNKADTCLTCQSKKNPTGWSKALSVCTIGGKCQSKWDKHPGGCGVCDPAVSTTKWVVSGPGFCLIQDNCWVTGAPDNTGCKSCQPTKDPYAWTQVGTMCWIGNQCYVAGAKHPQGCAACDPLVSNTKWTASKANTHCLINNTCYLKGAKDPTGCSACDPAKDRYGWTTLTDVCKIGSTCQAKGAKHPQGCAECVPSKSTTAWTATSHGQCFIKGKCVGGAVNHTSGCGVCDPVAKNDGWTVASGKCLIDDVCYAAWAKDAVGCRQCDPATASAAWTKVPNCFKIVFTTLNQGHRGNLGGVTAADALCAKQAKEAGWPGTFKAFLSDSTQNVKDLIKGGSASSHVVNTKGVVLYSHWAAIFTSSGWNKSNQIYSFNGTLVDEGYGSPSWSNADGWHGSNINGTVRAGFTCKDWTDFTTVEGGAAGELDEGQWIAAVMKPCSSYQAVVCVQVAP